MHVPTVVGPTYQSIVDHVGVSEAVLKRQCSREHLRKIAVLVPNWRELAINLGVQEGYIMDINSNQQLTGPFMKAHSVLYQWHRANGFMASYEILIGALQGDAVLAERVCRIAKGQQIVVCMFILIFCLCLQNWRLNWR